MRGCVNTAVFMAVLLGGTLVASATAVPSLTTTITMDCSTASAVCNFDPGSQGSPESGMADFRSVAPGWSASFDSAPAIAWGIIFQEYIAEFGPGGSFAIAAPGGMQFSGMLTSGLALSFPDGSAETVAWFQGHWNNGLFANGVMVWNDFDPGAPVTLTVTTDATPEPGSFLLFGSALAGLAGTLRRTLR
jgi:PEP-CTERM motif